MPVPSARCDYGFDNLQMYHRNVPADVESILLGIYQAIRRDILQSEYGDPTEALLYPLLNDFGASKQMILEAYESNSLDAFIQRFVRNALQRRGDACPRYFSDWLHYRLIIGPTRLLLGSLSSDVFERRTSTGSEPFSLLISLDATVFLLPIGLILVETICPKMCSKSRLKCAKSPFPVDVRRSKTSLLKLPIERRGGAFSTRYGTDERGNLPHLL